MQLPLPWDRPTAPASAVARQIAVDGRPVPVVIARHRRARRYVLRLSRDGALRLTVPRGASITGGLRFAARQAEWIRREWRRREAGTRPWGPGTPVWYRGARVTLAAGADVIVCGDLRIPLGDDSDVRSAVEAHLRTTALTELPARAAALAARHRFTVARVRVSDARSRWGSCSPSGVVALNWRLVQMPLDVRDYVILHELAHLRQPNHSVRFWREVGSVCAGWREAERWLRKFGKEIL